jgi:ATP-binding cassette subfamily F protein uup
MAENTDPLLGRPGPAARRALAVPRSRPQHRAARPAGADRPQRRGKTTLFRLIADLIEADKGKRSIQPGTRIVVLEQDPFFTGYATLMDYALHGPDAPARHEVEAIAGQLGIDMARPARAPAAANGAVACARRALAQDPDLLLLDEPTNHLDLAAIEWLEAWLNRYKGAFIAISHDRTFLKRLTRRRCGSTAASCGARKSASAATRRGKSGLRRGSARRRQARRPAQARGALARTRRHRAAQAQPGPARALHRMRASARR